MVCAKSTYYYIKCKLSADAHSIKYVVYFYVVILITIKLMRFLNTFIIVSVFAVLSCNKSSDTYSDPTYKVGDTTFSGSYLDVNIAERHYREKEVWKLAGGLDTMVKVRFEDPDSGLLISGLYGCIYAKDSFATYRLGGHGHHSKAVMLRYYGNPGETGNYVIRSGYIYVDSLGVQMIYSSDGIVNVFHNDSNYIAGTFSGNFALSGVEHRVNSDFKIYHTRRLW